MEAFGDDVVLFSFFFFFFFFFVKNGDVRPSHFMDGHIKLLENVHFYAKQSY